MNNNLNKRKALVFSPSASHPQDYGNRNRVFQTTSFLNDAGYEIHFLLYPFESDWEAEVPPSAAEMRGLRGLFYDVPDAENFYLQCRALEALMHLALHEAEDPERE